VAPHRRRGLLTSARVGENDELRDRLRSLFEEAAATSGVIERRYRIAGTPVLVRFAGPALVGRLAPALDHLAGGEGEPALTIDAWDSASTSTPAPPLLGRPVPRPSDGEGFAGPVYYYSHEGTRALARWGTLAALDGSRAWFWAPGAAEMISWDWAYPFRPMLDWWLDDRGIVLAHGGAVGTADGGVLVVGPGGSGKSTTTLASIGSRLRFAGDDLVGVGADPDPHVWSLFRTGKLATHHLERFPHLAPGVVNPVRAATEKAVSYLDTSAAIDGFPLRAVIVPRVTPGEPTALVEVSRARALAALAPSTILQAPPHRPESLRQLAAIVAGLPAYELRLGADIDAIPAVLETAL
jgi:hypothetical protein